MRMRWPLRRPGPTQRIWNGRSAGRARDEVSWVDAEARYIELVPVTGGCDPHELAAGVEADTDYEAGGRDLLGQKVAGYVVEFVGPGDGHRYGDRHYSSQNHGDGGCMIGAQLVGIGSRKGRLLCRCRNASWERALYALTLLGRSNSFRFWKDIHYDICYRQKCYHQRC